jgi:hypothetical protein
MIANLINNFEFKEIQKAKNSCPNFSIQIVVQKNRAIAMGLAMCTFVSRKGTDRSLTASFLCYGRY